MDTKVRVEVEAWQAVDQWIPLVHLVCKKICNANNNLRPHYDDLVQEGCMALMECCKRGEGDIENSFITYAHTAIRNKVWKYILKEYEYNRTEVLGVGINDEGVEYEVFNPNENRRAAELQLELTMLTEVENELVRLHCVEGYVMSETAKVMGLRKSTAIAIRDEVRNRLGW